MIRFALAAACLVLPAVAMAQPACNPEGTQQELTACAVDELVEADAELNRVYRDVLASRSGDPLFAQKLRAAQRLWIQLRDADLDAQFPLADGRDPWIEYGSIYPLERASAKTRLTRARTAYLREQWLGDDTGR